MTRTGPRRHSDLRRRKKKPRREPKPKDAIAEIVTYLAFMGFFMAAFMAFAGSPPPAPPKPRPLAISAMPDARSLAASRSADASRAMTSALRLVRRAMTSARAMTIAWLCWSKTVRNVVIARWILCLYAPRLLCFLLA